MPALICSIGLVFIIVRRKALFTEGKASIFWTSVSIFLFIYLLILASATYYDIYYQWNLNNYDLDKDGLFSGEERTAEQKLAMQQLTNDVGRNFSFLTGFIFSLIISFITYIAGLLFNGFKQKND